MKTSTFKILFFFIGIITRHSADAQTIVSGIISSNTMWTSSGNPYLVNGDILVDSGTVLKINPGVIIKFDGHYSLQIDGTIQAIGDSANNIIFTSNQTNPEPGDWNSLYFGEISKAYDTLNHTGCTLQYCVVEYAGGDLTAYYNGGVRGRECSPYIDHCLVRNNIGSGIALYTSIRPIITNSIIYNNSGVGLIFWGSGEITCNKIIKNEVGGVFVGDEEALLMNNILAENKGLLVNFGYWDYAQFSSNSFVNNSDYGILISTSLGEMRFDNNTFVGNYDNYSSVSSIVRNGANHHYHKNNFFRNGGSGNQYEIFNYSPVGTGSIDASGNYWGTSSATGIDSLIFDWLDDSQYSVVDYLPFLSSPSIDAPVSPVSGLSKTDLGSNQVLLQWFPNPETDIAGYKVYWGDFTGYSFSNVIDVGNVSSYTLSNVNFYDLFSVTAYDNDAAGDDDICDGHESWFTNALYSKITGIPNVFKIPVLNIFPNPSSDEINVRTSTLKSPLSGPIMIYSSTGNLVEKIDRPNVSKNNNITINVRELPDGIYFFVGHNTHGDLLEGKFLVQHVF